MALLPDITTSSTSSVPSLALLTFPDFRRHVESLKTTAQLRSFFARRLDADDVRTLCKNAQGWKKFLGLLQKTAESYFRDLLAPDFWASFLTTQFSQAVNSTGLETALHNVLCAVEFFIHVLERLSALNSTNVQYETYRIRDLIAAAQLCLIRHSQPSLRELVFHFYAQKLKELLHPHQDELCIEVDPSPVQSVEYVRDSLKYLELSEIHESAIKTAVFTELKDRLSFLAGMYAAKGWPEIYTGLKDYAMNIKKYFLECMVETNALAEWEQVLLACVGRAVGMKRIEQLYEMVTDFPESHCAVLDIRMSLKLGHIQEEEIISAFTEQVKRRLLQAGAGTQDIIYHFLKASKMFAEIDPNGKVMESVSETYKAYLRDRIDTMKCIVSALADTNQERPCVLEEMAEAQNDVFGQEGTFPIPTNHSNNRNLCPLDVDINYKALKEMQKVLKTDSHVVTKERSHGAVYDIVSTLLGIYSSQEQFTEEYQKLLAEKLMTRMDYSCTRECRILELLKKRFDDPKLSDCEVMMHDVVQSKGLNDILQESLEKDRATEMEHDAKVERPLQISAVMTSYLYWPEQREPQIQLPEEVQQALDAYAKAYNDLKPPRTLNWRTGAGMVELDVTIGNATRSFTVDPVLACIILKFRPDRRIKETDLAQDIGLTVPVLKARMTFWINNGILQEMMEDGEIWYQRRSEMERPGDPIVEDSDEELMQTSESRESDGGKFVCFKTYIMEFLRQRGDTPTTLEDIYRHLEKFVKQHTFDMSQVELSEYLDSLTIERVISQTNGLYKARN